MPESLFNKVAVLTPVTLLKKRPWHRCFPVNFLKFLRTSFFTEHLRWLLLTYIPINIGFYYVSICRLIYNSLIETKENEFTLEAATHRFSEKKPL